MLWVDLDGIPLGLGLAGGRLGRPWEGNLLFLLRFKMLVKTPPSSASSSTTFPIRSFEFLENVNSF